MAEPQVIGEVLAPLVNTNEPEAQVVEVHVESFTPIARGDHLLTLETSKSTLELESEYDGWAGRVRVALDDLVTAGDTLFEVWDGEPDPTAESPGAAAAGEGPKMTRKAEALAAELGVDPADLPSGGFVTEADVRAAAERSAPVDLGDVADRVHENAIVLYGGGGLAKTIIDLVRAAGTHEVIGVVDDRLATGEEILGVPVIGDQRSLVPLRDAGLRWVANAIGAIGRIQIRIDVSERIGAAGLRGPVLIEPSASVASSAELSDGAQVFAGAVVSAAATVGPHAIVNSGVIVSHDCTVGANAHLAPGAILAGDVAVGDGALVGMGVTVPLGVGVGARAVVGNGATVLADVPEGTIVPAGSTWPAP